VVNVASLNPTLAESELFGHMRGAFTGADQNRVGLVALANGGTLFLDEVAEIPLAIQVKLLRVLEQKEVVPVGSSTATQTDFRIIAATHQDLNKLVQQGRFRHDLFFRLSAFQIELPPLRDRRDDIVPLAKYFLGAFAKSDQPPALQSATEKLLQTRPWHGNVRELKNAIEHALIVSRGQEIAPEHLPPPASSLTADAESPIDLTIQIQNLLRIWAAEQGGQIETDGHLYEKLLKLVEPPVFAEILKANLGQLSNSARLLGLHRTTLRKKVDEYRLE
jgi:two-component system nitrogen regulation response regulator GlnG